MYHHVRPIGMATVVLLCSSIANSDCGSVPFYAPVLRPVGIVSKGVRDVKVSDAAGKSAAAAAPSDAGTELTFDPLKISVFEPRQRAIILWNGQEEILLLSTDQKASQPSSVLEVIPLPSEPTVRLGKFETFEAAQALVVNKRMWACAHGGAAAGAAQLPEGAGRIMFAERMGAHDLAVAEVLSPDGFVEFVQNYLRERYGSNDAPIRPDFVEVIRSYLDEGYKWFAFDVIQMNGSVQSREPVEYRFKSDRVHYPLRISSLESGKTEVELLVLSSNGANHFLGIPENQVERQVPVGITPHEVHELDTNWEGFFGPARAVTMDQWTIEGESAKLLKDVSVR